MELFENLALTSAPPHPLAITTPLGAIATTVIVDAYKLAFDNSTHFYSLEAGGHAARWELPSCIAEVVIARPSLLPEYWAEITDCWAFLWRFKAIRPIKKIVFEGSWLDGYTWNEGEPDLGQWLDAQTWEDGKTKVSLGTDGADALFQRAEKNEWLPQRFVSQSDDDYALYLLRYFDTGMIIDFGNIFPNELIQTHFVVAWSPFDEESTGTWNAVNLNAEHIIKGAVGKTIWG